jgi:hypothetical protein
MIPMTPPPTWTKLLGLEVQALSLGATTRTHFIDSAFFVIPAKAGIHLFSNAAYEVDPGFRRGDSKKEMESGA